MRNLFVSLHDVTPAMEDRSRRMTDIIMKRTGSHLTLLVVPDFHSGGSISGFPGFCSWLREMQTAGVEIALHGLTHSGTPGERSPGGRFLTDGEGEFASLGKSAAEEKITRGVNILCDVLGREPEGFTAPAWLYSRGTRDALKCFQFKWVEYRSCLDYGDLGIKRCPVVVYASRTPWKRLCSRIWSVVSPGVAPLFSSVRLGLHVRDLPELQRQVEYSLDVLTGKRKTLTCGEGAAN